MMREEVYRRIYEAACEAPGDVFVEIGTAHGAATVCLALAMQDTGRNGKVYTFDRFARGSRAPYGDAAKNRSIAEDAFTHFGVAGMIEVTACDAADAAVPVAEYGLLMLDADGRIDRDFATLFDGLAVGGTLIIDDMADRVRCKRRGDGTIRVDQKHRLTYLLTQSAEKHGLIEKTGMEYQTWFGRKRDARVTDWPATAILDAYRQLVFADGQC